MKDKILTFIIGVLVGSIIATAGFLIYNKLCTNNSEQPEMMQMNSNGQKGQSSGSMEEPPEKPDGDNSVVQPTKPEESNNNTSK